MFTITHRTVAALVAGVTMAVTGGLVLRADAAPGDTDSTFVPITPCRLIDTRPAPVRVGPHATFDPDETTTIQAHGTNGKCTIPADAVGLSLNVSAVNATALTDVRIWGGGDKPLAASLNPSPAVQVSFNAVNTPLAGDGSFQIFNAQGSVDLIVDVNGYSTKSSLQDLDARVHAMETAGIPKAVLDRLDALEANVAALDTVNTAQQDEIDALEATTKAQQGEIDALEATTKAHRDEINALEETNAKQQSQINALETLTASMSIETVDSQPTVRFTGVNVQVVDGSGDTDGKVNGKGNLVVGYNENSGDTRTGSHNLIIGGSHAYTSYGGLVAGSNNTITGANSSVSGGYYNEAGPGDHASVSGGYYNTASGYYASVSGGSLNEASGTYSSVSGGSIRSATGIYNWRAGGLSQAS